MECGSDDRSERASVVELTSDEGAVTLSARVRATGDIVADITTDTSVAVQQGLQPTVKGRSPGMSRQAGSFDAGQNGNSTELDGTVDAGTSLDLGT